MQVPKPGETFEGYYIINSLGEGGMGQVFLGEDLKLGRKVALKFLLSNDGKPDPINSKRFENEARILAALNHPNIVNIYNFGSLNDLNYLVMEYVEGNTLAQIIEKRSFGIADSIKAITQVVAGLEEAHENGILHRDIKPANILVNQKKNIKIVDFGISKSVSANSHLTQDNHFIGTIHYMAPEILAGYPPASASDLFSVGVVLYEMIAGQNPFLAKNKFQTMEKIRHHQVEIPPDLAQLMPKGLQKILMKMIARDKSQRYQSALDARKDLESVNYDELPDFHGVSLRPEIEVANRNNVANFLSKLGYSENESSIITNIAVKIEESHISEAPAELDKTVDFSQAKINTQIQITKPCLEKAIANFERSKSQVTGIKTNSQKKMDSKKIPFPLFVPSFSKLILVFGGTAILVLAGFKMDTVKRQFQKVSWAANIVHGLFSPENSSDQTSSDEANREVSSVPKANLQNSRAGSSFQFNVSKLDMGTGKKVDEKILLKIQKVESGQATAVRKSQGLGHWDTLHLSPNVVLPPLKIFNKLGTNTRVKVTGDYNGIYPLDVGKRNEFKYTVLKKDGTFTEVSRFCRVHDYKDVPVAGKPIAVFEIECTTIADDIVSHATLHYSPKLRQVVQREIKTTSGPKMIEEKHELLSYKLPRN